MTIPKIRVAVLEGGLSSEHEISLLSAANVLQNLDTTRFQVTPIRIHKNGHWECNNALGTAAKLFDLRHHFDVVFPVVHGNFCEDGSLQGLLEQADIPYVGCGVLASAIGMDKDISKRLAREAGIPIVSFQVIREYDFKKDIKSSIDQILKKLHFPIFIKPANAGSSVGVLKVTSEDQLLAAIEAAFQYDTKVLVEQGIVGSELEVAVLGQSGGEPSIVSQVGEIRPSSKHDFYSYAAKYLDEEGATFLVPAEISEETANQVQTMAADIFKVLECDGMARIDFLLEKATGKVFFNEINTIPGFTAISMYPRLMATTGISYTELLSRLIDLALLRYSSRQRSLNAFSATNSSADSTMRQEVLTS